MTDFKIGAGTIEAELKQFFAFLFAPSGGSATSGVLSGLTVTQTGTASGSVLIGTGMGVVQDALLSGATPLINNASATLDVFTGSPMSGVSNPRNDVVVFNGLTGDIQVLIGTPNAAPTDPTVPTTSLPLARLRHAANATTIPAAKIDDLRVMTHLFGGTQVVSSSAQRNALPKYVGLKVYRTSVLREETWDGTGWFTFVYGEQTVTVNASGDFSLSTGLSTILTSTLENANGGNATGTRQNITVAKNGAYSGGNLTGRVYAADDKSLLPNGTGVAIKWNAWGYA